MTSKHFTIGVRPAIDPGADGWVRRGNGAGEPTSVSNVVAYPARLTIDVTSDLRGRIKVAAFRRGLTVADMLRTMLEREFPEDREPL